MAEPTKRLSVPVNPARALRDLSRPPAPAPDDAAENNTILQTYRQTDQPTNKPADIPTDQQTDRNTDIQTDIQTDEPTNRRTIPPTNGAAADAPGEVSAAPRAPRKKAAAGAAATRAAPAPAAPPEPIRPSRPDGRTLRPRQETADRTMVTSLRLAVSTVEQLDEFCWRNRVRKQDVVQAALDLYFAEAAAGEG